MHISIKTRIGFDPVKEYDLIQTFKSENNMDEWIEYECTNQVTFVKEDNYIANTGRKHETTGQHFTLPNGASDR